MIVTVKTPSDKFSGKRCGITFRRGVAANVEVTALQIDGFAKLGYEVIPAEAPKAEAKEEKPAAKKATKKKSGE